MNYNKAKKYLSVQRVLNIFKTAKCPNVRRHLKRGGITVTMAIATLCIWLWVSGLSTPISAETTILKYAEAIKATITSKSTSFDPLDNTSFVNIAYDKSLTPINDEYGFPKGNFAITDREKLARFLKLANASGEYRNILIDVYFDPKISTEADSVLFRLIASTPRLFIPKHKDLPLPDSSILHKTSFADYQITVLNNDFQKYPLFVKHEQTIAAKMYQQQTKHHLKEGLIIAFDNNKLMLKSIIPALSISQLPAYDINGEKVIYNLGEDILAVDDSLLLAQIFTDKNIIVGDLTESDFHATFKGNVSGLIIHYNTFLSLCSQKHIISRWFITLLIVLFSFMIYRIIYGQPLYKPHNHLLQIAITWCGFSVVLSLISLASYYLFSVVFDVFITSSIFTLYQQAINLLRVCLKIFGLQY